MKREKILKKMVHPDSPFKVNLIDERFVFVGQFAFDQTIIEDIKSLTKELQTKLKNENLVFDFFFNKTLLLEKLPTEKLPEILAQIKIVENKSDVKNQEAKRVIKFFENQSLLFSEEDSEINRTNKYKEAGLLDDEMIEGLEMFQPALIEHFYETLKMNRG